MLNVINAIPQWPDTISADEVTQLIAPIQAELHTKADCPTNSIAGHLAALDANGNLADSGSAPDSFADVEHTHALVDVVGLNVALDTRVPLTGGTLTGALVAGGDFALATGQVRNITIANAAPTGGVNGDVWIRYA